MSNSVPSDLKARVLARVQDEPSPTRRDTTLLTLLLALGAVGVAVVVFQLSGGFRPWATSLPRWFVMGGAAGWLVIATVATLGSYWRGQRMTGHPWQVLTATVIITPFVLFVWMHLWGGIIVAQWPLRVGFQCLSMSLEVGALPLLVLVLTRRGTAPTHPGLTGAALGATAGAWAGVVVDLWCPIPDASHVLIGHVLPVLLLAETGALLGKRMLGVRYRGRPTPVRDRDTDRFPRRA